MGVGVHTLCVDVSPGCPYPTVSLAWVPYGGWGGGHGERSARAKCQLYPPTYPFPGSSPAHHTASSWDPKIARPESPPMVQPTGAPPIPASR